MSDVITLTEEDFEALLARLGDPHKPTPAMVELFRRHGFHRGLSKPMEASCECGGTVTVRTKGLGIIDYHCIKCGATAQTYEQDDGTLKFLFREQYRRATDP